MSQAFEEGCDIAPMVVTEQPQPWQVAYAKGPKPSIPENLRSGSEGGKNREKQDKPSLD